MRLLMISATFPYPPSLGGTQVRTFHLLKYLSQRHAITLVTQRSESVTHQDAATLAAYVDKLVTFPKPTTKDLEPGFRGRVNRLSHFVTTGTPSGTTFLASPAMARWIDHWVTQGNCDAITCEHSVNEVFVRPTYHHRVPKVVANIHSSLYGTICDQLKTGTEAKPLRDRIYRPLLRRYERRYIQKFTDLVLTTEDDRQFFEPIAGQTPLHVVPNGVDLASFPYRARDPGGYRLVFVGAMDYIANVDAAKYLVLEILPRLQQRYPDTQLWIVGSNPTPEVNALAGHLGVTVTGPVASVVGYLHRATVCVVPMRTGYGIKNKTLEALAAGVPVVASDRGLEGLDLDQPQRALRANSTAAIVNAIGQLFDHPSLRATLAQRGRAYIEHGFSWYHRGHQYEKILMS